MPARPLQVLPVSVRGLVLPVLVALRDIAPGEELLRDYGADWWRALAGVWVVAEDVGLAGDRLFRGAGGGAGGSRAGAVTAADVCQMRRGGSGWQGKG